MEAVPGVNGRLDRVGDLYIGGQPDEAALRALVTGGVRVVVNLRTPMEMDDRARLPYDESAVLAELGVRYLHVPVGGPAHPWRPEVVDAIRDAILEVEGDAGATALLHCQSGIRTSWAFAAYLVREEALPLGEAHDFVGVLQDDSDDDPYSMLLGITPTLSLVAMSEGDGRVDAPEPTRVRAEGEALAPATGLNGFEVVEPRSLLGEMGGTVTRTLAEVGPLFVAGQPDEAALQAFKDAGVTVVVNLRGRMEMENREWMPFDEAAAVAGLGMEYVWLPMGMGEGWGPETADALAAVLARSEGRVLLHCQVAWRASLVYAAYLARQRGWEINAAIAEASKIYPLALPLEGLLGGRVWRGDAGR